MVDFSFPNGGGGGAPSVIARQLLAQAVNAGDLTNGAWRTRPLNELARNVIGASLASNRVTVPAGTYYAEASAVAYRVDQHEIRLYDITGSAVLAVGCVVRVEAAALVGNISSLSGVFTLSAESDIELQHRCITTVNTNGMGPSASFGSDHVPGLLKLWKVG